MAPTTAPLVLMPLAIARGSLLIFRGVKVPLGLRTKLVSTVALALRA